MGDADDSTLLHVHDLPQLYSKPSASTLLSTLETLKQDPHSLSIGAVHNHDDPSPQRIQIDPTAIPRYLTSIISSSLHWIADEPSRERVWTTASIRLSERSGRTAVPSLTRSFEIPVSPKRSSVSEDPQSHAETTVLLHLYEPSLTSDNLGFKTWTSSVLLSRRLHRLQHHTLRKSNTSGPVRILELGSGTGLLGLSAACAFSFPLPSASVSVWVTLTDLSPIIPNLQFNIDRNAHILSEYPTTVRAEALDWSDPARGPAAESEKYDVILSADPLYSAEHPRMLVETVGRWIRRPLRQQKQQQEQEQEQDEDAGGCFIVGLPLRKGYEKEREEMKSRLEEELGMRVVQEGREVGVEDWQDSRTGEKSGIEVWWGIWKFCPKSE